MNDRTEQVGTLLKMLADAIDRKSNMALQEMGMTRSQIHVLLRLEQAEDNTLSFTKLKNQLGVAQPTAWGLVRRLEAKGMVQTLPNPNDGRSKLVEMTEQGHDIFQHAYVLMGKTEEALISGLDEQELGQLRDSLMIMLTNCENLKISDL